MLVGFLDGPLGVCQGSYCVIDERLVNSCRNSGGSDMIGCGDFLIHEQTALSSTMENCIALNLHGELERGIGLDLAVR